jgi:hypothetical protein
MATISGNSQHLDKNKPVFNFLIVNTEIEPGSSGQGTSI